MHFLEGVLLAKKMLTDSICHIHSHYASQPTSVARVISSMTNIPFSFTAHAHDIWQDKLLLPEKLEEALFITTCSKFGKNCLAKEARTSVSQKIHIVYHGIDIRKFKFPNDEGTRKRNVILSIGRLTEQKGFPDLIKACAILKANHFSFECIIIGEGEQRLELQRLIKLFNLDHRVKLLGAVTQENLITFYHTHSYVP